MNNSIYWVWLTNLSNITSDKIAALLEHFADAQQIYQAKETEFAGIYGIHQAEINSLMNKNLEQANKIIERTKLAKAQILVYDDINYPDMLRKIENPPYVLYVKGEILKWDRLLGISVVGTRKYTEYGAYAAKQICAELASRGVTIISGMARGIDSYAAIAALSVGNKTIAVLGCGIDVVYPPENGKLMDAIVRNGAVVTEYPPGALPLPHHFPERNRIISGLSRGTLVVEAPLKSGALITANYSFEAGKDLFAVPGHIYQKNSAGANQLIRQGAKLVMNADDILEEYTYDIALLNLPDDAKAIDIIYEPQPEQKPKRKKAPVKRINNIKKISIDDKRYHELSEEEKIIIAMLIEENLHIDTISRKSAKDIKEINTALTLLEMKGLISKLPGNNYKINI